MAAPTPTARATPSGVMSSDGHGTKITLALDTNIEFTEIETTPFGLTMDDPIDITTDFNSRSRTFKAPALFKPGTVKSSVRYDPAVLDSIIAALGREDTVTILLDNGDTWAAFAYLASFEPGARKRGEPPMADIEIQITNYDHVNCVEALPVFTAGSGTAC